LPCGTALRRTPTPPCRFRAGPHALITTAYFVDSSGSSAWSNSARCSTSRSTSGPGEPPEYDRYTVLHVKRDGKWQMALARDGEGPASSAHEQLRPLAWLVGDWVDGGGSAVFVSSCRWTTWPS
jgi:hypothetical protein